MKFGIILIRMIGATAQQITVLPPQLTVNTTRSAGVKANLALAASDCLANGGGNYSANHLFEGGAGETVRRKLVSATYRR